MLNPIEKQLAQARGPGKMTGYALSPLTAAALLLLLFDSSATAISHDVRLPAREMPTDLPAPEGPAHHTTGAADDSDHDPADSPESQPAKRSPAGMPETLFRFEEQGQHARERRNGERRQNLPVLY